MSKYSLRDFIAAATMMWKMGSATSQIMVAQSQAAQGIVRAAMVPDRLNRRLAQQSKLEAQIANCYACQRWGYDPNCTHD